jgi:hypothetical protein
MPWEQGYIENQELKKKSALERFHIRLPIAYMFDIVAAFFGGDVVEKISDGLPKGLNRSFLGFAQQMLEFGKQILDGIKIGTIRRQV